MAPLDTGSVMNVRLVDPLGERFGPSPNDYPTIGAYLRAMREHKGLTLADLAETTRIRKAYLQGLEEADRSAQPSRPFAIGYVRSYAQALGIDGDAAAARFKRETPIVDEPFHDPVGVAHDKPKRSPLIIAAIAVLLSGVVLWNVVQRIMVQGDRATSSLPVAAAEPTGPPPGDTTVEIGAATPAPAAQNLPAPYKVPGLDAPAPVMKGGVPVAETASVDDTPSAAPTAETPAAFKPQGAVFGAPSGSNSLVVLQARKPASLIVRGVGGAVYFARQLAVGEAYRAPDGQGLTAEVADPSAFALYVAGENKGVLVAQQTALDRLAVRPAIVAGGASPLASAPVRPNALQRAPVRRPLTPEGNPYPTKPQADPQGEVAYYPRQPAR